MNRGNFTTSWWGPPKKFQTEHRERRVSWLELFFDLVYVIAIAKITHHFSANLNAEGFLEYACLFTMIYWGWLNGSMYHDLHGNQGLRTRLMTLWQMMIIAALAIVLSKSGHHDYSGIIIVFMIMQAFIIYLWWSVGFYDRAHRRYSFPYTTLYLVSLALMMLSLFISQAWLWIIVPVIFTCNYVPPFIAHRLLKRSSQRLDLSSSMFERLGLFTIIIFGELTIGVVNGIIGLPVLDLMAWINFALALGLVFGLWWIFFTMIARREAKNNFARASLLELLYIPALIALGILAAGFPSFFNTADTSVVQQLFGYGIGIFLLCISLMMVLLRFTPEFREILRPMQLSICISGIVFLVLGFLRVHFSATGYLVIAVILLNIEILYLNYRYYRQLQKLGLQPGDEQA